jgi:hypothetical protein
MSKVFVFWDIDGTINVNGRISLWNGQWLTNTVTRKEVPALFEGLADKHQSFNLRVNQTLRESVTALDEHPNVVNAWLTAWEEDACKVFSPKFNFPNGENWHSFTAPEGSFSLDPVEGAIWWKTSVVREFLIENPDARVIWVDDLIDSDEAVEAANRQLNDDFEGRLAMIGVIAHKGVTPDSFAFIKRLAVEKWEAGMFLFE